MARTCVDLSASDAIYPRPISFQWRTSSRTDVHLFGAKKRIAGLKLTATDMDWSHGNGPEVTGPAEALVMMMAGRLVALDDLSGEGKTTLVTRR